MSRQLSPDSNLDTLKKEAKRWLKAIRAGNAQAQTRLLAASGAAIPTPGLRDVQFALAREYGQPGWAALRQALEDMGLARRSHAERVEIVLRAVAWGGDAAAAGRIHARWPEVGTDNLYAAVATGNLDEVRRRLAADPSAATRRGGPLDMEPLLYLTYSRLPGAHVRAVDIALMLLDHGADPNARFMDNWGNAFTVLTGVIGEGEGETRRHRRATPLSSLLIERGANPFDPQALYNTSIKRDDTAWLSILWRYSERFDKTSSWSQIPGSPSLGGALPSNALNYLLGNAVAHNHLNRAAWLLAHGADVNALHAYSKRPLREEALVYGYSLMVEILERHGAPAAPLQGHAAFQAACMRLDRETARSLVAQHPEYLLDPSPMLAAARGRADVVALLLELGMDVDLADRTQQRGLHNAAASGAIEVAKLLIAHGANIDRPTMHYGGAMGFAAHYGQREMAAFLAPLSRDVMNLTYLGMAERLRELLTADPALITWVHPRTGNTLLYALPDDEEKAAEMATLLLTQGADPGVINNEGITAEQSARKRGLIAAADIISGKDDD